MYLWGLSVITQKDVFILTSKEKLPPVNKEVITT